MKCGALIQPKHYGENPRDIERISRTGVTFFNFVLSINKIRVLNCTLVLVMVLNLLSAVTALNVS